MDHIIASGASLTLRRSDYRVLLPVACQPMKIKKTPSRNYVKTFSHQK